VNLKRKISQNSALGLSEQFRRLSLRMCELVAHEGIEILPYQSEELSHFNELSVDRQQIVIHQLFDTVSVYEEMSLESVSLRDNPQLIWRSMSRSGLTPPRDIFDKITSEDIVVIFAPDQRQLFRNLEFLRHSILTLEELYATEWYRYTKRDPTIVKKLRQLAADIGSGKKTGTFDPEIEEHVIEQLGSQGNSKLRIKINAVSPITSGGRILGIIVVERGWPVED
jgi:hypothetical protein